MISVKERKFKNLAEWRDFFGLSQMEASRMLRISQARYSRLERRIATTRGKAARRIWKQTGVPLEVLVGADL